MIRKGSKTAVAKPTIDTWLCGAMRIKRKYCVLAEAAYIVPANKPPSQTLTKKNSGFSVGKRSLFCALVNDAILATSEYPDNRSTASSCVTKMAYKDTALETMHRYYTPKAVEFQAVLAIFTIFVNYADFYVNIIMLT